MDMHFKLRKAIQLLEKYRVSGTAAQCLETDPREWKRRENYLNFVIKSLWQSLQSSAELALLRDDLHETLEHGFYHHPIYNQFVLVLRIVFNLLLQAQVQEALANTSTYQYKSHPSY